MNGRRRRQLNSSTNLASLMLFSSPPLYTIVLALALLSAPSCQKLDQQAGQMAGTAPSAHRATTSPSPLRTAKIGLLPPVGGISLDHLLLALIGIGYGLRQILRSKKETPSTGPAEAPATGQIQLADEPVEVVPNHEGTTGHHSEKDVLESVQHPASRPWA